MRASLSPSPPADVGSEDQISTSESVFRVRGVAPCLQSYSLVCATGRKKQQLQSSTQQFCLIKVGSPPYRFYFLTRCGPVFFLPFFVRSHLHMHPSASDFPLGSATNEFDVDVQLCGPRRCQIHTRPAAFVLHLISYYAWQEKAVLMLLNVPLAYVLCIAFIITPPSDRCLRHNPR